VSAGIFSDTFLTLIPGSNPTIVNFNASAVKTYNILCSIVRFQHYFFCHFLKTLLPTTTLDKILSKITTNVYVSDMDVPFYIGIYVWTKVS
jgi:hypothetical protein